MKSGSERKERFRRLCAEFGLKEVQDAGESTPRGDILLAEGFKNFCAECPRPAYVMLWYIRRGGNDDIARRQYFYFGEGTTREGRINAALNEARQTLKDAAHVGLYDR